MIHPKITLRYFDARGRAQFLRYYLLVRNVDFDDERVPVESDFASWLAMRDDAALTGPFHKLPVLGWGDEIIGETLTIAAFLHRQFGDEAQLDDVDNRRHAQLLSSLYGDVVGPVASLIWADFLYPGVDFEAFARRSFDRLTAHLRNVERALQSWNWTAGMDTRPIMLADAMLWEVVDALSVVLGPHLALDALPTLGKVHERYRRGTAFSALLDRHPCPITARADEPAAIERIRRALTRRPA